MIELKDWIAKLGLGSMLVSMVGWFANNLWRSYQKRIDNGRKLVDGARPELVPLGTSAAVTAGAGYLRVGIAQGLCLAMSHCSREASGGSIQAGEEGQTEELYFGDQPVYREDCRERKEELKMVVRYHDRFGNPYKTTIPFSQEQRADGRFNVTVQNWGNYGYNPPKLSIYENWKIMGRRKNMGTGLEI